MFRKELSYYFSTPIAYIVLGLFSVGISLFLWVIPGAWNIIDSGYANADGLFAIAPWLLILVCPALTMRLFSEERRQGTWDVLRSQPVSLSHIVAAKYFAALVVVLIGLVLCTIHIAFVYGMAEPKGNVDLGAFFAAWIGLLLLSAALLSLSIMIATVTDNQIAAFVLSALLCFAAYWIFLQPCFTSIARGVVDLRDLSVFLLTAVLPVLVANFILAKRP